MFVKILINFKSNFKKLGFNICLRTLFSQHVLLFRTGKKYSWIELKAFKHINYYDEITFLLKSWKVHNYIILSHEFYHFFSMHADRLTVTTWTISHSFKWFENKKAPRQLWVKLKF